MIDVDWSMCQFPIQFLQPIVRYHALHPMFALLHIWPGFPVPGTAAWRQGSRLDDKEIPGWYFAEKSIAERYAFSTVFIINGCLQVPVQTMLEVSV